MWVREKMMIALLPWFKFFFPLFFCLKKGKYYIQQELNSLRIKPVSFPSPSSKHTREENGYAWTTPFSSLARTDWLFHSRLPPMFLMSRGSCALATPLLQSTPHFLTLLNVECLLNAIMSYTLSCWMVCISLVDRCSRCLVSWSWSPAMAVKACLPTLDVSSTFVAHASSASSTSSSTQTRYQHKKSIYRQQRSELTS